MKKLTKQEQIDESIKRLRERFYPELSKMVDDVKGADVEIDIKHLEDFLKQELEAIAEKTREDTKKEILKDIATAYHGTDDSSEGATVLFIKIRDKLSDKESK